MMKKRMTRMISTMTAAVMLGSLVLTGCGSSQGDGGSDGGSGGNEKPTVTLMIELSSFPGLVKAVDMAEEKFPEYNIVSKEWSIDGVKKAIKTTYAAGGEESIDIAFNSATGISGFAETDMLLNLSPYLDEDTEWSGAIQESMLQACMVDGNVYGVPWQAAYPVFVANKDIFDEVGIEIKDDWTYDELMDVAATLQENGYFAFGVNTGNSSWLIRQSYLNGFESEEELDAFNRGEVSMHDEKVVEAFDRIKAVYDNNYCYPGEGAIAATDDELKVGMSNGQIALFATTNSGVSSLVSDCGLENYQVVNFPSFSNYSTANLLGAPDVYFIPSNTKNEDAAVEVLKYLTSEEVLTEMANLGVVVPLKEVEATDPNYPEYSKDLGRLHTEDFCNLSDEIGDYISNGTAITNYIYDGETALDELEEMRMTAIGE